MADTFSIITLRSNVAMNLSPQQPIPVEYVANVVVELLGYKGEIDKAADKDAFQALVSLVNDILKEYKKDVKKYTKEALLTLVKRKYLESKTLEELMAIVPRNLYCWYPDEITKPMCFKWISPHPPMLRDDYGDQAFEERLMEITEKNIDSSQEEMDFQLMWQSENLPTSLCDGSFFWQYIISEKQYKRIKAGLESLNFSEKDTKYIEKYAFNISFFLAEWFKREYDGDNTGNGLSVIGLDTQKSSTIWGAAHLPNRYLVHDGQNEWLYSMYVLGGFPITYIKRVKRFDSLLFREIFCQKKNEEIDDKVLADIVHNFPSGNNVYQESLQKGGSWYAYIESLLSDVIPLSPDDELIEPYASYCKNLSEGKRLCYESFLSSSWSIFTDGQTEGIDAYIKVKIGFKKDRCYIPYECVRMWVGVSTPNEFVLGLETEDGKKSTASVRFTKSGDYYVGWGDTSSLSMKFDIQESASIKAMLYSIDDFNRENGKMVQPPFEFGNYRLFYQTNTPYKWSTELDSKARVSVLYNALKYQVPEEKERVNHLIPASHGKPAWAWCRLYEQLTLLGVENQEEIVLNAKTGFLSVTFNKQKGVKYNCDAEVTHSYSLDDGTLQSESVPLVLGVKGIQRVKLFPFEESEPPRIINDKEYNVVYKQRDSNYMPFDEKHIPDLGMIQLKLTCSEGKPYIRRCFFVPKAEILKRKIETKTIRFFNKDIPVWKPCEDDIFVKLIDNAVYDNDEYKSDEDVIPFRIGTESDFITLNVYRSDNCKEIYFENEKLIKKYKNVEIPLILKNKFFIRIIDEDGVRRVIPGNNILMDNDFVFNGKFQKREYKDPKEDISYYLFTSKLDLAIGSNALRIASKQKENYKFYYWSGKSIDMPILLNTTYNEENSCLMVPIDILEGKSEGIVFQSLKDATPPNCVFPKYPDFGPIGWQLLSEKLHDKETQISSLKIASEHKVYFTQFYPLHKLFKSNDKGRSLIELVMEYLRRYNKRQDFHAMHRFADEFLFEWFLLPYSSWKKVCKSQEDRDLAEKLFRTNPHINSSVEKTYLDLILEKYWNMPQPQKWNFQRSNKKVENLALQCMRNVEKDYAFVASISKNNNEICPARNIEILTEIHSNNLFYRHLHKIINEKILNNN